MAIRETLGLFKHPFMEGDLEVHDDGTTYPKVKLAPAGVVLPYERIDGDHYVYLIEQIRPECGNDPQLKTVGSYLRGQNPVQAMKDALLQKAGIRVTGDLRFIGKSIGYSVARTEIYCYAVEVFEHSTDELASACVIRRLLLDEAINKALVGQVMDDCTTIPLLALYRELTSHS